MRLNMVPLVIVASVAMACSRDQSAPNSLPTSPTAARTSLAAAAVAVAPSVPANECATPGAGWLFCDDFESDRLSKYFEYDQASGAFVRAVGTGVGGSVGMRATYTKGSTGAGSLKVAFGRTPSTYFRAVDAGTANYREVYWRFFARREAGWVGNGPGKLTRAMIFAKSDWSQAMIAHGWTDSGDPRYLTLDPASGTTTSGTVTTVGYNDFNHLRWLGASRSAATEEDQAHVGQWACYEFHVKLNDAGQSNGVFELSVNGQSSARKTGLNWVGAYKAYGLNAVFLEQFQNEGAPAANVRTLDNFVVSTKPVGCGTTSTTPTPPPAPAAVASVSLTPASSSATVGKTIQLSAVTKDASGNTLTDRAVTWTSANTSVATVNASGLVTLGAVGSTTITASSEGKSGAATVSATPIPVALVAVTPTTATGTVGKTVQLTASLTDAGGNALTGRVVSWSSSNSAIASVNTAGLVSLVAAGNATVTATSEGRSGSSSVTVTAVVAPPTGNPTANECAAPGAGWLFCDDFESDRLAKYFEYDNAGGSFVRATGTGVGGSVGMRATYKTGSSGAGSLKVAFGRTPSSYFRAVDAGTANYRELYWRVFVRREAGWVGNGPGKLTRAMIFAKSDWSEAMIAHGWTDSNDPRYMTLDPASGTDVNGALTTVGYNDFDHLRWLGASRSAATEEDQAHVGQWACYEFHVKLNDAGQSNGVFELSVNGQSSARRTGLNWVGAYNAYGLNSVFLEQFQNEGAPAANVRTLDNFVVSTQPIGCGSH